MNFEDIKARLGLIPHPEEGGYFVETYRCTERPDGLPKAFGLRRERLKDGGTFALLGCTVAPGFEFADYDHGDRESWTQADPEFRDEILRLT